MSGQRPERTCVGCGDRAPQGSLLRIQATAPGELAVVERPGPGRSAYLHRSPECLDGFVKSKGLFRSLRLNFGADERRHLLAQIEVSDG